MKAPRVFRSPNQPTRLEARRTYDRARSEAKPWRGWYGLKTWRTLKASQLAANPLCELCSREGLTTLASVVNHRAPHEGDWALFTDPDNHQSVCKPHHDRDIQRAEAAARRGVRGGGGSRS